MKRRHVLISGAGIAGPAAAFWLARGGFTTTIVERSPRLRTSGHAVDLRGAQVEVLRRTGLLERVVAAGTGRSELRVVNSKGRPVLSLPPQFAGGEVEIARGELSSILYEATAEDTEYIFGDRVTELTETGEGVAVTFAGGGTRLFDLVVGADGLHSGVRALTFGPEERFRTDLGYYVAGFGAPNHLGLDHLGLMYNVPGRGITVAGLHPEASVRVTLVFASEPLDFDRHDAAQQRKLVADRFADVGWEVPRLLDALSDTDDLYLDPLCQVRLPTYSRGRTVLLGDAAWGAGPGGGGTGLAMTAAYVLAGELAHADDHGAAFQRFEREVRPAALAGLKQAKGAGPFLAPATRTGIWLRDRIYRVLTSRLLIGWLDSMSTKAANVLNPRDYPL